MKVCYKKYKRPKLITRKSVKKLNNLSQCPRNTQGLTTENVVNGLFLQYPVQGSDFDWFGQGW